MLENPRSNPVHFPPDRSIVFRLRPSWRFGALCVVALPPIIAWLQFLIDGLPAVDPYPGMPQVAMRVHPFPGWMRLCHYVNFLFLTLLVRSGLSILMDHPRLYFRDHCTPGEEWAKFTPVEVPRDRIWTAKDDARYISPWLALPGYRHTIGLARHWHRLVALFWLVNGLVFVTLLFLTGEFERLIPDTWSILPRAWSVFVHYATLHWPPQPDPLVRYDALQQLAYFGVIFVMAPLSVLTGLAMSPAIDNRFRWYPRAFGGRQSARSIHFLLLIGYVAFFVVHVTMVFLSRPRRNLTLVAFGHDDGRSWGIVAAVIAIASVVIANVLANRISWRYPRQLQWCAGQVHAAIRRLTFRRWRPRVVRSRADISPFFWPNGKMPVSDEWQALAATRFENYRLKITGLVENPCELSLDDLKALGRSEQITMHHCIQGWSGIAQWAGLPMARLIEFARPLPEAKVVAFRSFGEGLYGGEYYDTQPFEIAMQDETILAWEMNFQPLPHLYGAPLRLRVESQLGYKMVKWIREIEFVASETSLGKGYGGKNEDDEFFDLIPEI